jgi:hypothetical protein
MWYQRRGNKYGNTKKEYGGLIYHSKSEAGYARDLDLLQKAKKIKSWDRQVRIRLDVNGYHICNYICDFRVVNWDESIELHEVKGFRTQIYEMKRKLLEATYLKEHPDIKFVEIVV